MKTQIELIAEVQRLLNIIPQLRNENPNSAIFITWLSDIKNLLSQHFPETHWAVEFQRDAFIRAGADGKLADAYDIQVYEQGLENGETTLRNALKKLT